MKIHPVKIAVFDGNTRKLLAKEPEIAEDRFGFTRHRIIFCGGCTLLQWRIFSFRGNMELYDKLSSANT
jgi:hypothetical protein